MEEIKIEIEVLEDRADDLRCDIAKLFYTGTPNAFATDVSLFLIPDLVIELKVVLGKIKALTDTLDAVKSNATYDYRKTGD